MENEEDVRTNEFPSISERLAKRRKLIVKNEQYVDCSFILGSVAEVEGVWSISKYVLSGNRRSMTPQLFEALMFLRFNTRLWDQHLVSIAISSAKGSEQGDAIQAHVVQESILPPS